MVQCDECNKARAKYRCPVCGANYCSECEEDNMGQCSVCAPTLELIKDPKRRK